MFPFLCALLFSMKDISVRWGLGGGGGQPILAAAIAALTSTVEIFLITRYAQGEKFALPRLPVLRWFVWSGIFTGCFLPVHVCRFQYGAGVDRRAAGE